MNAVVEQLTKLEANLAREIAIQQEIQELLDQQLEILLRGRTRNLAAVLAKAEEGLAASQRLDGERAGILAALAATLGVETRALTMRLLEEMVGEAAGPLSALGAELKERVARIREANRQVALLLRHSVVFIEDLVRAVTGGANGAKTYTREGELCTGASGAMSAEA